MKPQVLYQLIARVNGEQVYQYTSPLPGSIKLALGNAEDAVVEREDELLTEFSESGCQHTEVEQGEDAFIYCLACGGDVSYRYEPDYDAIAKDMEVRSEAN